MNKYAREVQKLFRKFAETPNPLVPGTAWQAEMFVLSEDVSRYAGLMGSINTKLQKISSLNADAIKDLTALIKNNKEWIKAAKEKSFGTPGTLKKNEKATRPKK